MEIKNLFQALENKAGKPLAANWQRLEKEVENSFIKIECETDEHQVLDPKKVNEVKTCHCPKGKVKR